MNLALRSVHQTVTSRAVGTGSRTARKVMRRLHQVLGSLGQAHTTKFKVALLVIRLVLELMGICANLATLYTVYPVHAIRL